MHKYNSNLLSASKQNPLCKLKIFGILKILKHHTLRREPRGRKEASPKRLSGAAVVSEEAASTQDDRKILTKQTQGNTPKERAREEHQEENGK